MSKPRRILQIGDIAGVARGIEAALAPHANWTLESMAIPHTPHATVLGKRLAVIHRSLELRRDTRSAIRSTRPDIVHLHWARFAPIISHPPHEPLVVHAHGSDVRGRSRTLTGRLVQHHLRAAAAVIAATPDLLDDLPTGACYFPNPVDTEQFSPGAAQPPRQVESVLFFAQMIPIKGAAVIIDAAKMLRRARPSTALIGFAGGSLDAQARAAGIELLPRHFGAALVERIRSTTVVVGQMRLNELGLSELESMACARPVVCNPPIHLPDAPVVGASTASELAEHVIALLDNPELRAALGTAARAYVTREHALPVYAQRLIALYGSILAD